MISLRYPRLWVSYRRLPPLRAALAVKRQSQLAAVRWHTKPRPRRYARHLWRNGFHREAYRAAVFSDQVRAA